MILERADLKRLRIPLIVALLLAGTGVAALVLAENRLAQAERFYGAEHRRLVDARTRLAKVSEEEQDIRNKLAKFRKFEELRMAGSERRLEWIEAITAIRQKRELFQVQYTLEPKRPVDYPGMATNPTGSGAIFMASKLVLELALLHEGDLLNFLSDFRAAAGSYVMLRSCSVSRTERGVSIGGPLRPRLHASCVIDMITIREPNRS
ncbi:MAG: hypothetical protein A3H32_20485 [Betaproteobacteria bacterium RIFCSPLOWO2_02_FULL_63_19]|nr:MAG: hypothetical protein A3H32_20485 [Betaproteobacteria bacterium RIFCSPLOWO2_02_FULL_63_19]